MSAPRAYRIPQGPAVDDKGRLSPAWHAYVAGLQTVSERIAASVAPLGPTATLAEVIAKQNEMIAALKAAGLMED